jgi:glutathione S-transferase
MSAQPAFTLYTSERCPFAARVRIVLTEKGIPHTRVEIELSDRPAYMFQKNPTGTVPVLEQDDGFVLPESRAIMEYLEERFPTPRLLPRGLEERAQVRLALDQFERFSGAYYGWRYHDKPAERLHEQLDRLDSRLQANPFVGGAEYGLADVGYLPWVLRAEHRGVPIPRYEAVAEWVDRLQLRPAVRAEVATIRSLPTNVVDSADLAFWA